MRVSLLFLLLTAVASAREDDVTWQDPDIRFKDVNAAIEVDDFKTANDLLRDMQMAAKRSKDQEMQAELLERMKEEVEMAKEFARVADKVEKLKSNLEEKSASTSVGRYECVIKGNWKKGLPLLAQCEDTKLAAAARLDLDCADDEKGQMEVANGWWQLAQSVTSPLEKQAYQIRSRRWMLRSFSKADYATKVEIDRRLKLTPLVPNRIVIWNTHNGGANDRGALAVTVSTAFQGKGLWRQSSPIPFQSNVETYLVLRPKSTRTDEVRVEINRMQHRGGGLSEIEVIVGRENVARGCFPYAESTWEDNEGFAPIRLVDGLIAPDKGYWLAKHETAGWAIVPLVVSAKAAK